MSEELIAEVDWNDNVISVRSKKELKQYQFPHRVALILPRTNDDKFILARRAKDKFPCPDVWVFGIGGHVKADETYEQAALREMKEETGFETEVIELAKAKHDGSEEKIISKLFTTREYIDIILLKPDVKEIQFLKEFSIKEISEMIDANPVNFAPNFITVFKAFLESNKY